MKIKYHSFSKKPLPLNNRCLPGINTASQFTNNVWLFNLIINCVQSLHLGKFHCQCKTYLSVNHINDILVTFHAFKNLKPIPVNNLGLKRIKYDTKGYSVDETGFKGKEVHRDPWNESDVNRTVYTCALPAAIRTTSPVILYSMDLIWWHSNGWSVLKARRDASMALKSQNFTRKIDLLYYRTVE